LDILGERAAALFLLAAVLDVSRAATMTAFKALLSALIAREDDAID
jgi:hypothetical protein